MSIKLKNTLSTFASALCLSACSVETGNSNEVDPSNIFGDYNVIQDGKNGTIQALNWFRYAGQTGTTLRLTDSAEISVNAQKMNLVEGRSQILNFTGSYYSTSINTSSQTSEYSFEWNRNDGKKFRNTLPAPQKIEAVMLVDGTDVVRAGQTAKISSSKSGFMVTYEGSSLGPNETIICTLWSDSEDANQGTDYVLRADWNHTLKNCVFKKEVLQRFRSGPARLEMSRTWKLINKAQGHERAGSSMTSLYKAPPIELEVSR